MLDIIDQHIIPGPTDGAAPCRSWMSLNVTCLVQQLALLFGPLSVVENKVWSQQPSPCAAECSWVGTSCFSGRPPALLLGVVVAACQWSMIMSSFAAPSQAGKSNAIGEETLTLPER